MRIGELAQQAGVSTKTVRYYESIGLIEEPPRKPTGYRIYDEAHVSRLAFISSAKRLGLTLGEIGDILGASDQKQVSCPHVVALLEAKRDRLSEWIRDAEELRDALDRTILASRDQTAAASADCCPVIERGLHERAVSIAEAGEDEPVGQVVSEGLSGLGKRPVAPVNTMPSPKTQSRKD